MQRVLVTGGAGFIGSHIVDRLVSDGYDVGVLDNISTGNLSNIDSRVISKIQTFEIDISDYPLVGDVVRHYEAIIHEAALVSVTRSVEDPLTTNTVNITGTLNLLKAAVDFGIKRFIYASSSSVYGETATLPKIETMSTLPISPYAVSKMAAENYCKAFAKVYGLHTISLRYFNVYGPRQKAGMYSGVIPTFVKRAMDGKAPIIYGDGLQVRDFTYVQDVVQANVLALTRPTREGEVYNVGAGNKITITELAEEVLRLAGKSYLEPIHEPERKGDIRESYADITKARRDLGFEPKFTIREGLPNVFEWFSSK